MARANDPEDTTVVRKIADRKGVTVGKPSKVVTSSMRAASCGVGGGFGGGGGSTMMGSGGNPYSPEMSTDFLELPQSDDEKRNFYRFFYDHDPFVGQAIDLLDELPLSKVRLRKPKARNEELASASLRFCENWAKKIGLLHRLMEISHEWNLMGETHIFCEDTSPDMPDDIEFNIIREITAEGEIVERKTRRNDADERVIKWLKKNYKGWSAVRCLPPEQVTIESFPFTDEKLVELIPDSKTKAVINRALSGDEHAARVVNSMPRDVVEAIISGQNIPLNTDPEAGSFYYNMARKKSQYEPRGKGILGRCFLPGTPIWIERGGVIQQVPVEAVEDQTDLLLTHKGRFRLCKAGSRPVDEQVVHLFIDGMQDPLRLTSEHEVLRVRDDGTEEWVEAGKLRTGDLVQEGHVVPADSAWPRQIDLVEWWQDRSLVVTKRGRPHRGLAENHRTVKSVGAVVGSDSRLTVTFEYENDNRNRARSLPGMAKLLAWAGSLSESVVCSQADVAFETGLSERDVRVYAPRLRKEGLLRTEARSLGRGRGQQLTWFPLESTQVPLVDVTVRSPTTTIDVTEDLCYLLGTWLGDGCVWTDTSLLNVHSVGWSLHDPVLRDRVVGLVQSIYGDFATGSLKDPSAKSGDIRIEDPLLARWFMGEFGHTAQGKHLPRWIFDLPEGHVLSLLRGLLDTDGWVKKGRYPRLEVTLDNRVLLDQVHLLCNRLGMRTKVEQTLKKGHEWTRTWQTKTGPRTKTYQYPDKWFSKLTCSRIEDVSRWACLTLKGGALDWVHLDDRQTDVRGTPKTLCGQLTRKVKAALHQPYTGKVYSFHVEGDESHVTGGVITHNCLRTLIFRDKVRQSLTSIASRHMTPYRVIYAEDMNAEQTEDLREQVDLALQDPDFSIIANYQINWEEMGADQRLPDWSWVYDFTDRQMYAGLGVTESLLSGESSYSGDRINLEVINTRFMLMRETLQELVENQFFAPMCARMGFVEEDEDGNLQVIVPHLSFTRLSFRDNTETFDALMNLYQKGSLDVDTIYEHLNLDPVTIREKLRSDVGTIQDSAFNEILRGLYTRVGDALAENSDFTQKIAEYLGLKYEKPKAEGEGRF